MISFIKKIFIGKPVGRHISRSRAGNFLLTMFLIVTACFMGLPLLYTIMQSFKPMQEIFIFPPRFFVHNPTINNYYLMTQYANNLWVPFSRYLFNSVFITLTATAAEVIICSMAAFILAKGDIKGKNIIFAIIVTTLLFSYDTQAIPQYVVMSWLQLINNPLAIILPAVAVPLGLFLMKQFMEGVPDSLIESAKIDGASYMRTFWSIVMPMVKPAWLTLIIFSFQSIWGREGLEFIYNESFKVLPTMLRQISAGGIARAGVGAAAAVVLMLPPIITFILAQSKVLETMAHSGIK